MNDPFEFMSDESSFTTDKDVLREVKNDFLYVTNVLKLRSIQQAQAFPALVSLFVKTLIDNLLMLIFFIFETARCVWVRRFYTNNLFFFCPAWDSISSENILYVIT